MAHSVLALTMTMALLVFFGCGGLPDDFESLPLPEQVAAYERHLASLGHPLIRARSQISWHGREAAMLMTDYLKGERKGLPRVEAIDIIQSVQLRGCDLAGTEVQATLEELLRSGTLNDLERMLANLALDAIVRGVHVPPGTLDSLRGGPCETETYGAPKGKA